MARKRGKKRDEDGREQEVGAAAAAVRPLSDKAKVEAQGRWYAIVSVVVTVVAFALSKGLDRLQAYLETPLETDAFIISYPKSGNNWLRFLLGHVYIYGKGKESRHWLKQLDFNSIEDVIPDMEYGPSRKEYRSFEGPRIFKSHQPYAPQAVPGKCDKTVGPMDPYQCNCPNCPPKWKKVVVLVRDGRDAMCSYYHFRKGLRNLDPMDMSFQEFLLHDGYPGYTWAEHVSSYLNMIGMHDQKDEGKISSAEEHYNMKIVKYEDLHADTFKVLKELSDFLGLVHDDDVIRHAIENSSFQKMRGLEVQEGLKMFDEEYPHRDRKWKLTRKGAVGGWAECFVGEDSKALFNRMAYPVLEELGYVDSPDW